ncbi:aspartyl-phosphate phosphatase Spo0E family protein [Paenibacillus sp. CGMCC 1.16610]|uniref:Spo0E family sporulation regulatory protein-aspartic acid phosphatase n=1 Tax=Paenibacillus anseongense TaxID=2682845 RepID=A0ABW9UJI3_9BACL|nr:aspartyl-phosphate phosphatase Spo0E family protein [Paenibacillus sp. CGMCC 1.16610]MVQ39496.1 Spo0E family sporulation regulatory protein-aspartic acid phosphatase [Paenibacillus anseongense]
MELAIERKRYELNNAAETYGVLSDYILGLSKELDELLNKLDREKQSVK